MIDAGQSYRWTAKVTDTAGAAANATTITLTITLPDGTTTSPAVTNPPAEAGTYIYDYATAQAGLHKFAVTVTPATLTVIPAVDYIDVRQFISVLSLAEAKKHLNKISTADDDELRNFLMAVTELIETKAGICVRRDFTERVEAPDGSSSAAALVFPRRPLLAVASVTSVWNPAAQWLTADLSPDLEAGIIWRNIQGSLFTQGPWNIAATAGRTVIRERHLHAAKELLHHVWDTQRGAQPILLAPGEESFTSTAGLTFTFPRRVLEGIEADVVPSL